MVAHLHLESLEVDAGVLAVKVVDEGFEEVLEVGVGALDLRVGVQILIREVYARTVHANTNIIFSKGRNYQSEYP